MDRLNLAHDVARRLVAAEQAIDAALQAQAALVARLATAGGEARVAAPMGDPSLTHASAGLAALAAARSQTVACHAELAKLAADLRAPVVDVGQGDKDPPVYDHPHKPRARTA